MLETTYNLTRRGLLRYGLSAGLLLPTLPSVSHAQGSGKFYAIIVGVSEYESGYQTLIAGQDATRLAGALRGLGYEQPKLVSGFVKKQELLDRLKVLLKTINPADTLLFFFGGHGSRRPLVDSNGDVVRDAIGNVREEEYLLFSDTKDDDKEFIKTALSMSELEVLMQKCVARQRIFIFDACRTTSIPERKSRDQKTGFEGSASAVKASFTKYQARLDAIARAKPKDFKGSVQAAVLWSCSPGERSYEPKEESTDATGVFTERVLLALQGGLSGIPTAGGLRDFIRSRMPSDLPGPQTPDLRGEINVTLSPIPVAGRRRNSDLKPKPANRLTDYPALKAYVDSLCSIPGGTFTMGRGDFSFEDIKPEHLVTITDFHFGQLPVSVKLWQEYSISTKTPMPERPDWGWIPNHPMVKISWDDCLAFASWASEVSTLKFELPSEAQWEYAATTGGSDYLFPWGGPKSMDDWARYDKTNKYSEAGTRNVWSDIRNNNPQRSGTGPLDRSENMWRGHPWKLLDLVGNVSEWCADWYDPNYYGSTSVEVEDPVNRSSKPNVTVGDKSVPTRSIRGVGWDMSNALMWLPQRRFSCDPTTRFDNNGVRYVVRI
jgi:formylglycine-generating enzyme required for sulfatase activity